MNPNFKLNLLTLSLLAITSIAHAEDEVSTQELDEIQVKGKHIAKEKKVFTEGQAKSSRERVYQSSENIDTIVRSMPGVFTQQDKGSGVLAVNIRGDSGLGRVNTMVDGVPKPSIPLLPMPDAAAAPHNSVRHWIPILLPAWM